MLVESVELYFFNVFIIFFILLISYKPLYDGRCVRPFASAQKGFLFFTTSFILIELFLVFQFTETDYWHYYHMFNGWGRLTEPLQELIRNWFENFYLWRLFVWGGAFFVFILSFKRLGLSPRVYIPLFVVGYLSRFISREQLGLAIMLLGSTYIVKPLRFKSFSYILGVGLVLGSYFFHNSMVFSIAMLLPAFFKVNWKRAVLVLLLFVPLIYLANYVLSDTAFLELFNDSTTNTDSRIAIYTEQKTRAMNFNGLIRQLIYWSPMIIMLVDVLKRTSNQNEEIVLPNHIRYYLNYWFYMFILSFIFFWQASSAYISVRFLDKSLFAMVIVLSYWFSIQKPNKRMRTSLWLFLLYIAFNYSLQIIKAM